MMFPLVNLSFDLAFCGLLVAIIRVFVLHTNVSYLLLQKRTHAVWSHLTC